ncbi:MAG: GNAT family N-acetyltransferase [Pirellulales bacterium]
MESDRPISCRQQLDPVAYLSEPDREAIRLLSLAVYPPETLADWPGRHIEWSPPEWCVPLWNEDGTLVSYVGVHLRDALCEEHPVRIGGVGGVKTHPTARGRGLASLGVRRAVEFFGQQPNIDFALLVCEPRLLGFYSRLGWREFNGRLLVQQHGASAEFTFNRVMTHPIRAEAPTVGVIDLRGPPW